MNAYPMRRIGQRQYLFFVLAALGVLMASIDSTIVAVGLPNLERGFHAPLHWVGWTLTIYSLVQIILLPIAGKLSDTLGRKRVFLFCLGIFTLGSLLCALSPSIGWLIAFRALQAVGGGGLMPSAVGIVSDQFAERRAQAIGLFTSVFPIGGIIGPNLGGYLLAHWSWRSLFLINVPLGIVVLAGVYFLLVDRTAPARKALHVDWRGLSLFGVAMVALLYGMTAIGDNATAWRQPYPWALIAISVVLLAFFLRHISRTEGALMDYRLVVRSPFLAANAYNFFFGAASFGFFSFVPYYAVVKFGLTTQQSGTVITPRALLMIATSTLASIFLIRLGYRLPMLVGMALVTTSLVLLGLGRTSVQIGGVTLEGFWLMAGIVAFSGVGMGLAAPASNNAALDLAPKQAAELTGLRSMFRMTGGVIGIAGVVTALSFFPDQGEGLARIFLVLAGILLLTVPLTLMIPDTAKAKHRAAQSEGDGAVPGTQAIGRRPALATGDNGDD
ncbi:MAG: MFS transporter [Thermomicrobiales bacterium]